MARSSYAAMKSYSTRIVILQADKGPANRWLRELHPKFPDPIEPNTFKPLYASARLAQVQSVARRPRPVSSFNLADSPYSYKSPLIGVGDRPAERGRLHAICCRRNTPDPRWFILLNMPPCPVAFVC